MPKQEHEPPPSPAPVALRSIAHRRESLPEVIEDLEQKPAKEDCLAASHHAPSPVTVALRRAGRLYAHHLEDHQTHMPPTPPSLSHHAPLQ